MKAKKILVHLISSLQRGGAETVLINLIKHLPDFEHHVFYFYDGPLRHELNELSIATYHIKGLISYFDPYAVYVLINQIKRIQPVCIHTSLWAANIIGYIVRFFTNIPVISAVHALCEHEGNVRTWIERCLPMQPSSYIAVSSSVAQSLVQKRNIHPSRITIIHNGIDTSELDCYRGQTREHEIHSPFVIGAVGRLVAVKNYQHLLHSVALIHPRLNIQLMLVGQGPQEKTLRSLAHDLGIHKKVLFITGQKALAYYQYFDCFVQPSLYEGLSLALLEALYFKLLVVVSSQNKHHEVITHRYNGLITDPCNIHDLAETLTLIINNKTLRNELRERAHFTVLNNFTIEKTATQYRALIEREMKTVYIPN